MEYDLDMHRIGHILNVQPRRCDTHGFVYHVGQTICIECDFEDWLHCRGKYRDHKRFRDKKAMTRLIQVG